MPDLDIVKGLRDAVLAKAEELMERPAWEWMDGAQTAHLGPRMAEKQKLGLRLSHGLNCSRRLWLNHHMDEESNPSPASIQFCKFSVGDLWESWSHQMLRLCAPEGWEYVDANDLEVVVDGIPGHLDGYFVHEGEGLAIISDSKFTSPHRHKKWDDGLPDVEWGQLHQAGNYIAGFSERNPEWRVCGFVWPSIIQTYAGPWRVDVGYATAAELKPYRDQAAKMYEAAQDSENVPRRLPDFPGGVCRYCGQRDTCKK